MPSRNEVRENVKRSADSSQCVCTISKLCCSAVVPGVASASRFYTGAIFAVITSADSVSLTYLVDL